MRIAFITPEFVTDHPGGGGLGNYLNRMAKLLVASGHQPEIFVSSQHEPGVLMHDGIRVERVRVHPPGLGARLARRTVARGKPRDYYAWQAQARDLAGALERRHGEAPFDAVQSADYLAVGRAVPKRKERVHLIRCSWAADLYNEADGKGSDAARGLEELERTVMRGADRVYAPSRFLADHFRNRHGLDVEVLRPPGALEVKPAAEPPCGLPDRFLVYFGQFLDRKGIGWLGHALPLAFEMEPSLRMVLAGRDYSDRVGELLATLGPNRCKVLALHPLPKPELYALVQRAEAAVLPSLVDNLPNTVIESLLLGIPVIGTRGASIDELVEPGITGELADLSDAPGLAAAMVKVWRGQSTARKGFQWHTGLAGEMQPDRAVEGLIRLASRG